MLQDFRLGLRRVLRTPGFSVSVVVILGVGVAAAATMASVLNALAFKPLSLPDPKSLVAVSSLDQRLRPRNTVLPAIERLRAAELAADGWCAFSSGLDATESAGRVLESWFEVMAGDCTKVLGLTPVLGRWFTSEETPLTGSGKPVMVITDRYWKNMFDRSPDVLGRVVKIQNVVVTVIGVMPERFTGFSQDYERDFILPFNAHRPSSGANMFVGRLKRGATLEQLRAQVRTMWPSLLDAVLPESPTRAQTIAETSAEAESFAGGTSILRRLYTTPVQRLAVLAGALLLLVCVNVGGLLLSRIAARVPEIAAMRALGAGPLRIARQLVAESTVFAIAGALLGVLLAYAASGAFTALLPTGNTPWTIKMTPDPMVLGGIVAGTFAMAFLIAALPIWLATRTQARLRTDRTVSRATSGWAKTLMVAQIAVTVVLVFAAGLIVRSFNGLQTVNRGYDSEHLLSLRLSANPAGYQGMDAVAYYRSLIDQMRALAGVQSVGLARYFGSINSSPFGQPIGFSETSDNATTGMTDYVSPGFFATAGVPLLGGRDVAWTDLPSTPKAAIVSESLARVLAPDGDVIGRVIRHGTSPATSRLQIVGVVGNLSMGNVRESEPRIIYLSSFQFNETQFGTVHIKTAGPPLQLANAATAVVAGLGREHVRSVHAHDVLFGNSIVAERMGSHVSGAAAALALMISCVGLFALMAHSVERRTREIGIRLAIGATPATISRAVLKDAVVLVLAGLAVGLPAGIGAAMLLRSLLFGVTSTDGLTLAVSTMLLIGTGVLASALPAVRAVRVDPATALRAE